MRHQEWGVGVSSHHTADSKLKARRFVYGLSDCVGRVFRVSGPRVSNFVLRASVAFRISDFGSRVSGFGFWVSGFGFRVSGFGFRVFGFGFRVSGFGFRVSGFGFEISSAEYRVWTLVCAS